MKKCRYHHAIVLCLLLAGCSASMTPDSIPVFATMSFTSTSTTLPPSTTPSPTQTRTPHPPTLTPLPVLQQLDEIKTKLLGLLQNNGGCQLPCLFGHTPGLVSLQEMKNFFDQFGLQKTQDMYVEKGTSKDGSLSGVSFYFPYSQDMYLNMGISAYKNGNQVEALAMGAFPQSKWDPYYAEIMNYYLLPEILTNYGEPTEVLVLTHRNDRQRPDITTAPFFLVLLYPDQGFFVEYEMNRETRGDNFFGCPSMSFVSISVWSPENSSTFGKITQGTMLGLYPDAYKSISDATSMTIEEFYQVFSNPTNKDCIKTPIETWPNP